MKTVSIYAIVFLVQTLSFGCGDGVAPIGSVTGFYGTSSSLIADGKVSGDCDITGCQAGTATIEVRFTGKYQLTVNVSGDSKCGVDEFKVPGRTDAIPDVPKGSSVSIPFELKKDGKHQIVLKCDSAEESPAPCLFEYKLVKFS
ncbi:MAG: hypothetical protein GY854_33035 [Deltaproteobacteria bacterium]|nr:hypothetical protein [Deltaproteobacteria bacterium]